MGRDTAGQRSLAERVEMTEQEMRCVEAEVAAAEYPDYAKSLIAATPLCEPQTDG